LPYASSAVTLKVKGMAVVTDAGAVTPRIVAGPGLIVIVPDVPVTDDVTESVAVMVCEPAVERVAEKVPVPLVRVVSAGSVMDPPSVLVK
jgi:hypothetical protein